MKFFLFPLIILTLTILAASCTKEVKYSKEDLLSKAQEVDSSVTLILPESLNTGPICSTYSQGCLSSHIVRVKKLDLIAVEFDNNTNAQYAAKKYRGYYLRNWFFDDVVGEPILEDFIEKLEAKKP